MLERIIAGVHRRARDHRFYSTAFGDAESKSTFRMLLSNPGKPGQLIPIRLRDGHVVWCRTGTTDVEVFEDVFRNAYHVPPSDVRPRTILDLGSNIGLTIVHYASLHPEARILGVELDQDNFELCRRNISKLGHRCSVIRGAAWHTDGVVPYAGNEEWGFHVSAEGRSTPAFSIESLLNQLSNGAVDLIKMDIEGAEAEILPRAANWIHRVRCLMVEVHHPYSVEECISSLTGFGLVCHRHRQHAHAVIATR